MAVGLFIFLLDQIYVHAELGVTVSNRLCFSGYTWLIKASGMRVGPGGNYFADKNDNVWVDDGGRLHLKITQDQDNWRCAEVISTNSFGFGIYRFHVSTPLSELDDKITLGLFTWSDVAAYTHREIDIECGKWGNAADTNNAQFVVQPYQPRGRLVRYPVPDDLSNVVYSFLWQSNNVSFKCASEETNTSSGKVIFEWRFDGNRIPHPGDENVRMNLWLSAGRSPRNTNHTEIVISKFEFIPLKSSSTDTKQP